MHLPFDHPVYDFVKINGSPRPIKRKNKAKPARTETAGQDSLPGMDEAAAALEPAVGFGGSAFADAPAAAPAAAVEDAPQCDVLLAAASREQVNEYAELLREAGFKLRSLEIKPFSLRRLLSCKQEVWNTGTMMIVDVGENAADFSIFHGHELKITRNIPVSFGEDANQLSESLFTDSDPDFSFRSACFDLADEIDRLMNFYRYSLNNREHEFDRILLLGDVPRLMEAGSLLAERLAPEVHLIAPEGITSPNPQFEQIFPAFAVPIGLALRENRI